MPNTLEIALQRIGATIVALKPVLIHAIGVETLHFIDDNFRQQGFDGILWVDRKKPTRGLSRKILVLTGTLRRSFKQIDNTDSTKVGTDIIYAKIHNEGGVIHQPSRSVILSYRNAKGGKLRLTKRQTLYQKLRITDIRQGNIGAHDINIPQRRFLGPSPILTRRCEAVVIKKLTIALKTP